MFVYGVCVGTEEKYRTFAGASLARVAPDSPVLLRRDQTSIFSAYNSILQETLWYPGLEGVILLHEDVELKAPVEETLREEFAAGDVAIVGAVGGRGIKTVSWSRSRELFGRAPDAFYGENYFADGAHDVDLLDGLLLALSPWAARNLLFDSETFGGFHAYDADICMQAKAAGHRVRVAEMDLFHHTKGGFGILAQYRLNDDRFRKKWNLELDGWPYRLRQKIRKLPY